jgi:putative DNA primase/helicase
MKPSAAEVAHLLGGRPEGTGFLCPCPVPTHGKRRGDLRPSLGVSDGREGLVFHCFAGCRPRDIFRALTNLAPALETMAEKRAAPPRSPKPSRTTSELARKLWRAALPVAGTPADIYLRARGFLSPPPATIRFLRSYRYDCDRRFPCLIAAVQAPSRSLVAVQLTFLDPSGRSKAKVPSPRRVIGPLGEGLLRTAPAACHIGLAEGFETAWGASLLHDGLPVWAVLGAERFSIVCLPPIVSRVTIFADHDAAGLAGALSFFAKHGELDVSIAWPREVGEDFAAIWGDFVS